MDASESPTAEAIQTVVVTATAAAKPDPPPQDSTNSSSATLYAWIPAIIFGVLLLFIFLFQRNKRRVVTVGTERREMT